MSNLWMRKGNNMCHQMCKLRAEFLCYTQLVDSQLFSPRYT